MNSPADRPGFADLAQLLRWVAALFGEPAEILDELVLEPRRGARLRGWLRALEAIARALLVLAAVDGPAPRPVPFRPRAPRPFLHDDPLTDEVDEPGSERWAGVAFRLVPPRPGAPSDAARGRPAGCVLTRPLAFRLEALIRVAEAPERYARRLARRLARAPGLAGRMLRRPARAGCPEFPDDDVGRAQGWAWMALAPPAPAPVPAPILDTG
jgi:hypothetical protein